MTLSQMTDLLSAFLSGSIAVVMLVGGLLIGVAALTRSTEDASDDL